MYLPIHVCIHHNYSQAWHAMCTYWFAFLPGSLSECMFLLDPWLKGGGNESRTSNLERQLEFWVSLQKSYITGTREKKSLKMWKRNATCYNFIYYCWTEYSLYYLYILLLFGVVRLWPNAKAHHEKEHYKVRYWHVTSNPVKLWGSMKGWTPVGFHWLAHVYLVNVIWSLCK